MRFAVPASVFAERLFEGDDNRAGVIAKSARLGFSVCYRSTARGGAIVKQAELLNVSLVPQGAFRT
jgi:hypothetical protein